MNPDLDPSDQNVVYMISYGRLDGFVGAFVSTSVRGRFDARSYVRTRFASADFNSANLGLEELCDPVDEPVEIASKIDSVNLEGLFISAHYLLKIFVITEQLVLIY